MIRSTLAVASVVSALLAGSAPHHAPAAHPSTKGPLGSFRARAERAAKLDRETQAAMAALRLDLGQWAKKNGIDASGDQLAVALLDRMSAAHRHPTGDGRESPEGEFGALEARAAELTARRHELDSLHHELTAELPAIQRRLRQPDKTLGDKFETPLVADSAEALAAQRRCDFVKIWFDGALNICVLVESSCRLSTFASTAPTWLVSCHYECIELRLAPAVN